jgi:hypothetical protein
MPKKRFSAEQINILLRQIEVLTSQGKTQATQPLRGSHLQRREACQSARASTDKVPPRDQPQDRQGARHRYSIVPCRFLQHKRLNRSSACSEDGGCNI